MSRLLKSAIQAVTTAYIVSFWAEGQLAFDVASLRFCAIATYPKFWEAVIPGPWV